MLKEVYLQLLGEYSVDMNEAFLLWKDIEYYHSKPNRHYHTLDHLADLYQQLRPFKLQINHWNVVLFSLFYHDIIYKSARADNEAQSAAFAEQVLLAIEVPTDQITLCKKQIIATKSHQIQDEMDTNYFTDADLSILGREQQVYELYCQQIRKEYSIYPTFLYRKGRRKVIQHFLAMPTIFKTDEFGSMYEKQARINLTNELNAL